MRKENSRSNKGITLIALIITIIIMIILVAVTVQVALNGGLFGKAEEGARGTEVATDQETLLEALADQRATAKFSGFKAENLETALGNGWECTENETEDEIIVISPNENEFRVDIKSGKIEAEDKNDPNKSSDTVYHTYADEIEFYKVEDKLCFDLEGWKYCNITANGTIGEEIATAIEEELEIDNVSTDLTLYASVGSIQLVKIVNDWYMVIGDKGEYEINKFEIIDFDTSVLEGATEFFGL